MNIAPTPNPCPPAAQPAAPNCPSHPGNGQTVAHRTSAEPELAVVAVLGYN